jgi:hypothetical protein
MHEVQKKTSVETLEIMTEVGLKQMYNVPINIYILAECDTL